MMDNMDCGINCISFFYGSFGEDHRFTQHNCASKAVVICQHLCNIATAYEERYFIGKDPI